MNRTSFAQYVNDLDTLRQLLDLYNDPKGFKKSCEEAKNELKLLDDEIAKYNEAKSIVAKQEKLAGELKDKQDLLTETQLKIEKAQAELDGKITTLADDTARFNKEREAHRSFANQTEALRAQISSDKSAVEKQRHDLDLKQQELVEFEKSLNLRVERITAREKSLQMREKALEL